MDGAEPLNIVGLQVVSDRLRMNAYLRNFITGNGFSTVLAPPFFSEAKDTTLTTLLPPSVDFLGAGEPALVQDILDQMLPEAR